MSTTTHDGNRNEMAQITMIDQHHRMYRCNTCRTQWSPNLLKGGKLPKGYWKCPNGCNAKVTTESPSDRR